MELHFNIMENVGDKLAYYLGPHLRKTNPKNPIGGLAFF